MDTTITSAVGYADPPGYQHRWPQPHPFKHTVYTHAHTNAYCHQHAYAHTYRYTGRPNVDSQPYSFSIPVHPL
jgi:hypothetical protein